MELGWLTELKVTLSITRCVQGPQGWEVGRLPSQAYLASLIELAQSSPAAGRSPPTTGDGHAVSLYDLRETSSGLRNPRECLWIAYLGLALRKWVQVLWHKPGNTTHKLLSPKQNNWFQKRSVSPEVHRVCWTVRSSRCRFVTKTNICNLWISLPSNLMIEKVTRKWIKAPTYNQILSELTFYHIKNS